MLLYKSLPFKALRSISFLFGVICRLETCQATRSFTGSHPPTTVADSLGAERRFVWLQVGSGREIKSKRALILAGLASASFWLRARVVGTSTK